MTTLIDYLNRTADKNEVLEIIQNSVSKKEKLSLAINGKWGSGKTFFLSLLEEEFNDDFFVIKYDAWENDYYDDPLIGILDLIKDRLNKYNNFLKITKNEVNKTFKNICKIITNYLDGFLEKKTGFSPNKIINYLKESKEETLIKSDFNTCEKLKIAKKIIIKSLNEIAKHKTVVFIVDEIDRCLPTYTLKVVERLHHIFENVDQCILLFGVDIEQLKKIIGDMYCSDVSKKTNINEISQNYLRKIIDHIYDLGNGTLDENFYKKIEEYRNLFSDSLFNTTEKQIAEFVNNLFVGIEMRNVLKIIKNAMTAHMIVFKNEVFSADLMCAELMLSWATKEFGDEMLTKFGDEINNYPESNYFFARYLGRWPYGGRRIHLSEFHDYYDIEVRDLNSLLVFYVYFHKNYCPVCGRSNFQIPSYCNLLLNDYLKFLIKNKC